MGRGKHQKTVIVLGMHRSGTSMIAGILYRLSVNMGRDLLGPMPSNPSGHFEDKEFVNLNERILKEAGGSWCNPPSPEVIRRQFNKFRGEIKQLTDKFTRGVCGWKDPRTCLTIELYLRFLTNPCLIITHREAAAVARSLQKRDHFSLEEGLELNRIYETRISDLIKAYPDLPRLELSYEAVLETPLFWINRIIEFLEIRPEQLKVKHAASIILPG